MTTPDIIDALVGIEPNSALDRVRANRSAARENAQNSYLALFSPRDAGTVLIEERLAIAYFVAGLHKDTAIAAHYRDQLSPHARPGLVGALSDEIRRGEAIGPYGHYPAGPLSIEDKPGPVFAVQDSARAVLGRLAPALEHAHLLVFRLRDANPAALQKLLDAGWSTTDIVTLSQLVAFLSFQIRVVTGLRALHAAPANAAVGHVSVPVSPIAIV